MYRIDLRIYKNDLRQNYKHARAALSPDEKAKMDIAITKRLLSRPEYKESKLIMIYASTKIEVDTFNIIKQAFNDGKLVALPRCIKGTKEMEFHLINSLSDLAPGSFLVLEPDENLPIVVNFSDALMIVPALSLDRNGYRLGYGGGYYDRYLSRFNGTSIGVCYSSNYRAHIKHGRYDKAVDFVLTDKFIRPTK